MLTGIRWVSNNYITWCHRKFKLVWSELLLFEAVRTRPSRELGPQGPWLSSPAEWERSAAIARRAGGQYVAVFVQSPIHLSHITLSQPFRIKCERYIFLKKCVRSSLCCLCFCMHMSMLHYLLIARRDEIYIQSLFQQHWHVSETQTASSKIWTLDADSISYDDSLYAKYASVSLFDDGD